VSRRGNNRFLLEIGRLSSIIDHLTPLRPAAVQQSLRCNALPPREENGAADQDFHRTFHVRGRAPIDCQVLHFKATSLRTHDWISTPRLEWFRMQSVSTAISIFALPVLSDRFSPLLFLGKRRLRLNCDYQKQR